MNDRIWINNALLGEKMRASFKAIKLFFMYDFRPGLCKHHIDVLGEDRRIIQKYFSPR